MPGRASTSSEHQPGSGVVVANQGSEVRSWTSHRTKWFVLPFTASFGQWPGKSGNQKLTHYRLWVVLVSLSSFRVCTSALNLKSRRSFFCHAECSLQCQASLPNGSFIEKASDECHSMRDASRGR